MTILKGVHADAPNLLANAVAFVVRHALLVAILIPVVFIISHLLSPYTSPLRVLPTVPRPTWLLGSWPEIVHGEAGIPQRAWVKAHGPVLRAIGPFGLQRVIFCRPAALQRILVSGWTEFPRPDFMRNILGIVTGYGLLTVTGAEHRQMRRAMNPAFSIPNLMAQTSMFYDPIYGLVDILIDELKSERPGEAKEFFMYEWMSKVTLDIICETAFGYTCDSLHHPDNELAAAYHDLINLQSGPNITRLIVAVTVIPWFSHFIDLKLTYKFRRLFEYFPLIAPMSTLISSMHRIKALSARMLEEKTADVHADDTAAKKDIMSLLVRARAEGNGEEGEGWMSDKAMLDQVLTFLGAGHETTASGLAWTLWLLANDKESQQKLRDEVTPLITENPRPDYRQLQDLQWLGCVVNESLRVLPPVPMTLRKTGVSEVVDGAFIPKNTLLYIPIRVVNTWQGIWGPDAEEFHPARWLNLPKAYNPTFSSLSFITGPHGCIGKTMAIVEMKAVLAVMIAKFEFEPAYEGQVAKPTAAVTMKPADNMPLRVRAVQLKPSVA